MKVETSAESLAQQFKHDVDQELLKKGKYQSLIISLLRQEPRQTTVSVQLRAAESRAEYPDLTLEFEAFLAPLSSGSYLGFVPTLGVEAAAETPDTLKDQLAESIRLEFVRNERLGSARSLLETQWFEAASVSRRWVDLRARTGSLWAHNRNAYTCFLPLFGENFLIYNLDRIDQMVRYFTRTLFEDRSLREVYHYLLPERPTLDTLRIQAAPPVPNARSRQPECGLAGAGG